MRFVWEANSIIVWTSVQVIEYACRPQKWTERIWKKNLPGSRAACWIQFLLMGEAFGRGTAGMRSTPRSSAGKCRALLWAWPSAEHKICGQTQVLLKAVGKGDPIILPSAIAAKFMSSSLSPLLPQVFQARSRLSQPTWERFCFNVLSYGKTVSTPTTS